jgi:hypothetical protein
VRDISPMTQYTDWQVEEIIENGVKNIRGIENDRSFFIEDTLEMGVKETKFHISNMRIKAHKAVDKGVKEIYDYKGHRWDVKNVIQDGVKETKTPGNGDIESYVKWMKENETTSYEKLIDDVVKNGIKEVQPLPDQSGELIGYGNYYHDKEDRTKAFIDYLEETIEFGVKKNLS